MPRQRIIEEDSEIRQSYVVHDTFSREYVDRAIDAMRRQIMAKYLEKCLEDGIQYIFGGIEMSNHEDPFSLHTEIVTTAKLYKEAPRGDLEFRAEYLGECYDNLRHDNAVRAIQNNSFYPRNSSTSQELGAIHPTPIQRVRQTVVNTSSNIECEDEPAEPITYPKINGAATKKQEPKDTLPWE